MLFVQIAHFLKLLAKCDPAPSEAPANLNIGFLDFDAKFSPNGFLGLPNVGASDKTSNQIEQMRAEYRGKRVSWQGIVGDVQGNQILIMHRLSTGSNEVALIIEDDDKSTLQGVSKGDLIDYTGTINNFGRPYPYTLAYGKVTNRRALSSDEQTKFLTDNEAGSPI